jgi:hypothetical protein
MHNICFSPFSDKPECIYDAPVTLGVVPKRDAEVGKKKYPYFYIYLPTGCSKMNETRLKILPVLTREPYTI